MNRNGTELYDDDETTQFSPADTSSVPLSSAAPSARSCRERREDNGWDPIPFNLFAYFFAAGAFFVTFNVLTMPELPFPLVGNLLKDTGYVQIPVTQGDKLNMAFLLLVVWGLHFLRRFFEVMYVHVYRRTMSKFKCIGAVVYYSFFGVWVGWSCNIYLDYFPPSGGIFAMGIIIFLVGEIGNFASHVQLKRLRSQKVLTLGDCVNNNQNSSESAVIQSQSGSEHVMPDGCIFARVSSPNYMFEMITWLGFAIASCTLASIVFFVTTTITVCIYAHKKHREYKGEFGERYPDNRKAIVPYIC